MKLKVLTFIFYWTMYPFRNSYKNKLRALLEGLETQHIENLIKRGKTGDFRKYGELYVKACKEKRMQFNR